MSAKEFKDHVELIKQLREENWELKIRLSISDKIHSDIWKHHETIELLIDEMGSVLYGQKAQIEKLKEKYLHPITDHDTKDQG